MKEVLDGMMLVLFVINAYVVWTEWFHSEQALRVSATCGWSVGVFLVIRSIWGG